MQFPKLLQKGDTIGVCAPSEGIKDNAAIDNAHNKIRELGYESIETPSVRSYITYGDAVVTQHLI